MKNYLKLLRFLKAHQGLFAWAVVFMFLASLLEGIQLPMLVPLLDRIFNDKPIVIPNNLPDFLQHFITKLNNIPPHEMFWKLIFAVLILLMAKNILTFIYN